MRKLIHITLPAVVLLLASAASYAIAATNAPPPVTTAAITTIHACKNNRTNALYLEARCPKGYMAVQWNARGPAGPAGAPGAPGANGTNGTSGANGTAASVSVGTVSTGAAGSNASVTNSGTSSAATLNFTIPRGATGATGSTGPTGAAGSRRVSALVDAHGPDTTTRTRASKPALTSRLRPAPSARRRPSIDFNGSTLRLHRHHLQARPDRKSAAELQREHPRRRPVRLDAGRGGGSERDGERVGVHRPRRLRQRWLMHRSRDRARRRRRLRRQLQLPDRRPVPTRRNGVPCADYTVVWPAVSARRHRYPRGRISGRELERQLRDQRG